MSILFISDLHLQESQPHITELFFRFLTQQAKHAKALYILGDFFEAWIGDDDLTPYHLSIIKALREITDKGVPIYFIYGNRDFLLGKKFFRATGITLLPDEYVLNLYGVPTLLMHGDSLCTMDLKYLKFRKKARNWFFQKLFLMKSLEKRRKIAAKHRADSQQHMATLTEEIMDVTPAEVLRVMEKHQVQHFIHGHTHRQAVHQFNVNGKPATRTVLGAWHEYGNVLVCDENGKQDFLVVG